MKERYDDTPAPDPDELNREHMRVLQSEGATPGERDRAMASIVEQYEDRLLAYAVRKVGVGRAEDVVQETFTSVFKGAGTYQPGKSFGGWIWSINRNRCTDAIRHKNTLRPKEVDLEVAEWATDSGSDAAAGPFTSPVDHAVRQEKHDTLHAMMRKLRPEDRETLMLGLVGYSQSEIAERLGIPLGTVKSRVSYGRTALMNMDEAAKLRSGQ